jgi:hypothetical protein
MAIFSTGAESALLRPGLNAIYGSSYNRYPEEFAQVFNKELSEMNVEIDQNMNGFGLAAVKPEGSSYTYASMQQGWKQTYQHITYGLGFIITAEAIEDNLYFKQSVKAAEKLGISMRATKETVVANILNRSLNSSYTGADGLCLGSSAHLLGKGGTGSNIPTTNAALSETALEQAMIDIGGFVDDANIKIALQPLKLVIPRQLIMTADRILDSEYQNDTADNALNVLKAGKYLPGGRVLMHYLTSPTGWYVTTDCPDSLKYFERRAPRLDNDTDFTTDNMRFKVSERYSAGWSDWRGIYCVQGL